MKQRGKSVTEKVYTINKFGGQNTTLKDTALPPENADIAQNCRFGAVGSILKRGTVAKYNDITMGAYPVMSVYRYYQKDQTTFFLLASCYTSMYVSSQTTGSFTALATISDGYRFTFVTYNNLCIFSNGYDNIMQTDGLVAWELGSCKAGTPTAGGSLDATAVYKYQVSFNTAADGTGTDSINGAISNSVTTTNDNKTVPLTNVPLGPTGTLSRNIWRTEGGGSTYYKIGNIPDNSTTTFSDTYADTTATAIGTVTDDMPKGKYIHIDQERLFVTGNPDHPNTVYYSDYFLPHAIMTDVAAMSATADAGDYYDFIAPNDGDIITGIMWVLGQTFVFKQNSIRNWRVWGDPTVWELSGPITPAGCTAPYSIANSPDGVIYQGWDHFYLFNGQYAVPYIDEFPVSEQILDRYRENSVGYYWNSLYLCAYTDKNTGSSTHNRLLVYDTLRKQLSVDAYGQCAGTATNNVNVNCFAAFKRGVEWSQLYVGDSLAGYVYQHDKSLNNYYLNKKNQINLGTHTESMATGREEAPKLGKKVLDDMEEMTSDPVAQSKWVTSVTSATEKIPPDLGTGSDGARTIGGTAAITAFAKSGTSGYTVVTSASHTLEEDDTVVITGATAYNGTYTATRVATDTFEIEKTFTATTTGTWTGGDVTLPAGTYNYTALTVNTGEVVTLTGNVTIKVMGDVTVNGTITGGSKFSLYAVRVTVGSAGIIVNGTVHIRCMTYTNGGTVDSDSVVTATAGTCTYSNSDGHTLYDMSEAQIGYLRDGDTATGVAIGGNGWTEGVVAAEFTFDSTNITEITARMYAYGASDSLKSSYVKIELYYGGMYHEEYIDTSNNPSGSSDDDITVTGSWNDVTKIRCTSFAHASSLTGSWAYARIYEISLAATDPVIDALDDGLGDCSDFVPALQCYSDTDNVTEGTYSLRVDCANGAETLDEKLARTITSISLLAAAHNTILIDVKASRAGTQFQLGIGESSTVTYVNVVVAAADTWETVELTAPIAAGTGRDAITHLALKFTNTDAFNRVYVDNITTKYTGTISYLAPRIEINAEYGAMSTLYWNEYLSSTGTVAVSVRTGNLTTTYTSWTDDTGWTAYTNPAGSDISGLTADRFIQYKVVITGTVATDYSYLYYLGGYVLKFTYQKASSNDEISVPMRWRGGYKHLGDPLNDKVLKKVLALYNTPETSGNYGGDFQLKYYFDTGQTYTFSIDIGDYPTRWESYAPSSAYGRLVRIEVLKDDDYDFELKDVILVYEPRPII